MKTGRRRKEEGRERYEEGKGREAKKIMKGGKTHEKKTVRRR